MAQTIISRVVLLGGLWAAAACDWKTLTIPRIIPRAMLLSWVALLLLALLEADGAWREVATMAVSQSVGSMGMGFFLGLMAAAYRWRRKTLGLGLGDIKLLMLISLYEGFYGALIALLWACLIAVVFGCGLPKLRWKNTKLLNEDVEVTEGAARTKNARATKDAATTDSPLRRVVPFAPALAVGTLLALCLG